MNQKISIIGVGLIGGSMGLVFTSKLKGKKIVGFDLNKENLEKALKREVIHEASSSLAQCVLGAGLVILATPVGQTIPVLESILPYLAPGMVVTDVGSTKAEIIYKAEEILPTNIYFVGGHPMAGSEISGVEGADRYLFENAYYLIARTEKTAPKALKRVREMVDVLGARVVELEAQEHDLAVAAISHLPHLMAVTLVNTLTDIPEWENILPFAAGGFRDTTRIALSSPVMWRDIFLSNRDKVLQVLTNFNIQLTRFVEAIDKADGPSIIKLLEQAKTVRAAVPGKSKGYLPNQYEIVVTVPDDPGMIAEVTGYLGRAGINIMDIEILRVREGIGGTIRLAFDEETMQKKAVQVLKDEGYIVRFK